MQIRSLFPPQPISTQNRDRFRNLQERSQVSRRHLLHIYVVLSGGWGLKVSMALQTFSANIQARITSRCPVQGWNRFIPCWMFTLCITITCLHGRFCRLKPLQLIIISLGDRNSWISVPTRTVCSHTCMLHRSRSASKCICCEACLSITCAAPCLEPRLRCYITFIWWRLHNRAC